MRRIAVINQKGGVGKTTTTANLGAALAAAGEDVLLIDLDPQGHLSLHFGVEIGDGQTSIYDVLVSGAPVHEAALRVREHVTVVPADIDLAGAEAELVSVTGREVLLREALQSFIDEFPFVLIDCPPSLGLLTINALVAAREVMIPLQAHFLALQGLSRLLDTVTLVRQRINPELFVGGIVLCMHESTTRLASEITDDLVTFLDRARGSDVPWASTKLYETCVRRNIKLAECASFGQTVFDYAPRSNGAVDYARLAGEVFGLVARYGAGAVLCGADSQTPRMHEEPDPRLVVRPDRPGVGDASSGHWERLGTVYTHADRMGDRAAPPANAPAMSSGGRVPPEDAGQEPSDARHISSDSDSVRVDPSMR